MYMHTYLLYIVDRMCVNCPHHDGCRPDQCMYTASLPYIITPMHATHGRVYHLLLIQGPPVLPLKLGRSRGPRAPTSHECESLHIQACGRGSWAVRGHPSHSHVRQQCGHTVVFLPFCHISFILSYSFQMRQVLNSMAHKQIGNTVRDLQ